MEPKPRQMRARSRGTASSDDLDTYIGKRIRLRRKLLGMSQVKLAERIGVTFQQVQKYERGSNRIAAARLYYTAEVLDVPITYFFDGFEQNMFTGQGGEDDITLRDVRMLNRLRSVNPAVAARIYELTVACAKFAIAQATPP